MNSPFAQSLRTSRLIRRISMIAIIAGAALMPVRSAVADDATPPIKVGICNPVAVIRSIQEFKDLNTKAQQEVQKIQDDANKQKAAIDDQQKALALLEPTSPQYSQRQDDIMNAEIKAQTDFQINQLKHAREVRAQTIGLFQKLREAVATVAKTKGFALVVADHTLTADELDKIPDNQLDQALLQTPVLFNDKTLDITQDVITQMDKDYNKH